MMKILLKLLALSLFTAAQTAIAANYYVRAGATGANNGADWANAYTSLPGTLTRGSTYYVADGSYSGYTFDDDASGTSTITTPLRWATRRASMKSWSRWGALPAP